MWWFVVGPLTVPVRVLAIVNESRIARRLLARRRDRIAAEQARYACEVAARERSEQYRRTHYGR